MAGHELAGRYRLDDLIAEGGMATVYRAVRVDDGREVAVKVMHHELARDRTFALRFEREAMLAGRLVHPRVVRMLDHGEAGGTYFLVMELLDGEDLFDVLARVRRLDEATARRVVIEVCEALSEAHGLGIVHRDMKLENVFISRGEHGDPGVKLLDFGVAKMREPEGRGSDAAPVLTAVGALLGTPEYMAPEHCRGEMPGPSADIYACGVLLYVLLTGHAPFTGATPIDVILKHISETPQPPSASRPDIHPGLDALVLSALAKIPAERPASASAFAEALRTFGPAPALTAEALSLPPPKRHSPVASTPPAPRPDATADADAFLSTEPALRLPGRAEPTPPHSAATPSQVPAPPSSAAHAPRATGGVALQIAALIVVLLIGIALGRWGVPLCR